MGLKAFRAASRRHGHWLLLLAGLVVLASPAWAQAPATAAPTQQTAGAPAGPLTGMDRVEYNSLIELARQAQQNSDLNQQKLSLQQLMDESGAFLQKHPDAMQIWQIRAAVALMLDDPQAGYEAGQKLLAAGAANSNDAGLQAIMVKLNLKGWLDKAKAETQMRFAWLVGAWDDNYSMDRFLSSPLQGTFRFEFSNCSANTAAGFTIINGQPRPNPFLLYVDSTSTGIPAHWLWNNNGSLAPVSSFTLRSDKKLMTIILPNGETEIFSKADDAELLDPHPKWCEAFVAGQAEASKKLTACSPGLPTTPHLSSAYTGILVYLGQCPPIQVAQVTPGSPAAKAGVQAGDIVESFQGTLLKRGYDINEILSTMKLGDKVQMVILHDGKSRTVDMVLVPRPAPASPSPDGPGQ